jgi:sugar (pentulose or hexulose) kinase
MKTEKIIDAFLAVIDIGKTNAKVVIVDINKRQETDRLSIPNHVIKDGIYPHYDTDTLWQFFLNSLQKLNSQYPIKDLIVITHGASVALVNNDLELTLPVLDYEYQGPEETAKEYQAIRPAFEETGSPALAGGLNIGAQLYWQQQKFPQQFSEVDHILLYPQYWAARFSGVVANEVTSLGCHSDLWQPKDGCYSSLIRALQLEQVMPPISAANDCLSKILPDIATETGLSIETNVYCGIHDSNASLCTYLGREQGEFTVVSTGTWVVAIALVDEITELDPNRDTLINVNAYGRPVPSARFMGGREYELIIKGRDKNYTQQELSNVLGRGIMLLPAVEPKTGPYQGQHGQWTVDVNTLTDGEVTIALSFYLALMTTSSLDIIQSKGAIYVEGPFGLNQLYRDMLSAAREQTVIVSNSESTGTSLGALQLLYPQTTPKAATQQISEPSLIQQSYKNYAEDWFALVEKMIAR